MKERPILFSAPMVRAILAGAKTQTRRIVRSLHALDADVWAYDEARGLWESGVYGEGGVAAHGEHIRCPYGAPGDRLWVRETWAAQHAFDAFKPSEINRDARWHYAATEERGGLLWRPSIHMPRWASRITLEVTEVRVERLQDISEEDARAEGVEPFPRDPEGDCWTDGTHRTAFEYLWGQINGFDGFGSWEANPWVWVVSFRRVEQIARAA